MHNVHLPLQMFLETEAGIWGCGPVTVNMKGISLFSFVFLHYAAFQVCLIIFMWTNCHLSYCLLSCFCKQPLSNLNRIAWHGLAIWKINKELHLYDYPAVFPQHLSEQSFCACCTESQRWAFVTMCGNAGESSSFQSSTVALGEINGQTI